MWLERHYGADDEHYDDDHDHHDNERSCERWSS
jgi:hypothetical protein